MAGIEGLVVDWERRGKEPRQRRADTEINLHTVEDLQRARAASAARLICRVDAPGPALGEQIEAAIACGADEVLLPMVRTAEEVELALDGAAGRTDIGVLIETNAAVASAAELAALPLARAYVGLNDLAIERRSRSIFDAIADGTVEEIRAKVGVPFGFGGLTLPDHGSPIPSRLLIAEMARLRCSFSFLRRSYRRDLRAAGGHGPATAGIRRELCAAWQRSPETARARRRDLIDAIARAPKGAERG